MSQGNGSQDDSVVADEQDCTGEDSSNHEYHQNSIDHTKCEPLVSASNIDLFKRVSKSFAEAERRIKFVDWLEGTDVPSINELRYVSYHLFNAFCAEEDDAQREELLRAERHCKRASYDALELGVINQFEKINEFINDYKNFSVIDVIPDYLDKCFKVEDARLFLEKTTGGEYRDDYYLVCEEKLGVLTEISKGFSVARVELNKKRSQQISNSRWVKFGVIVAFIAPFITYYLGTIQNPPSVMAESQSVNPPVGSSVTKDTAKDTSLK